MASFNKVILMGNLTRDPEVRQAQSGTYVARAGLAVNNRVPDGQGGWREEPTFVDLVLFGRQAESFGRWFQKGRPVLVEGSLRQSRWEDKETGQPRSKLEVIVDRWHFVGGREDARGGAPRPAAAVPGEETQTAPEFPAAEDFGPEDVPF